MKWEHKATSEKSWTPYSPEHTMRLSQAIMLIDLVLCYISPTQVIPVNQALRAEKRVVTLEHGDKKWIVDLDKMEQKPVVQPFMQYKFRQVRHLNMDSSFSRVIPR